MFNVSQIKVIPFFFAIPRSQIPKMHKMTSPFKVTSCFKDKFA